MNKGNIIKALKMQYDKTIAEGGKQKRLFNIKEFNKLDRSGLEFEVEERRLCLHQTVEQEKIYIQYPGKESKPRRSNLIPKPKDFRPKVKIKTGSFIEDFTFGDIFNIIEKTCDGDKEKLSIMAALFCNEAYMTKHIYIEKDYEYEDILIVNDEVKRTGRLSLKWYGIDSNTDWKNIDKYFGKITSPKGNKISFEAFAWMIDLLFQNEDCKYYYINTFNKDESEIKKYEKNLDKGRISSALTAMTIIKYLRKNMGIGTLYDKLKYSGGIAKIDVASFEEVTNKIVSVL